jgi:hypothetical protein
MLPKYCPPLVSYSGTRLKEEHLAKREAQAIIPEVFVRFGGLTRLVHPKNIDPTTVQLSRLRSGALTRLTLSWNVPQQCIASEASKGATVVKLEQP